MVKSRKSRKIEPVEEKDIPVRLAVYDSNGQFRGWKSDSFWTLSNEGFKPHDLSDVLKSKDNLIDSLIGGLKWHVELRPESHVENTYSYVVVEQIKPVKPGVYKFVDGLLGYHITRDKEGFKAN